MFVKDVYYKVLDLLDTEEYTLLDIAKELNVGIDLVKKVSQMRSIRMKFNEMDLLDHELQFLNNLWFNIVHLKEVDNKEDIRAIIELLQDFEEINKKEILIARGCLERKCKRIKEYKILINEADKEIIRLQQALEELNQDHKDYKERIKSIIKVIDSYPIEKRDYIYDLLGIFDSSQARFKYGDTPEYPLVMRPYVSSSKFRELKKSKAIKYNDYEYICEITDLNKYLNIMTKGRCKLEGKMNKKIFDFDFDYVFERKKDVRKKLKGKQKDLEEYKSDLNEILNMKLNEIYDEVEESYLKARALLDKYANSNIDREYCEIESRIKECNGIYAKDLFDIDRKHYVSCSDDRIDLYIIIKELNLRNSFRFLYSEDIEDVFKEDIISNIDNSIKYLISKLKHSVDNIYIVAGNNIELYHEEILSDRQRELTKFNICRKLNKDFLFLK